MKSRRAPRPLTLVAGGLVGLALFAMVERYHPSFVPMGDFARGLWVGVCIGVELFGVILLLKAKAGPAS